MRRGGQGMIWAAVFAAAFLPVYLLLREPFRRLPLHIDTGFYVSPSTVASGRWDFRRGWNAHFAGGSKLIPEAFFSRLYLLGGRGARPRARPRSRPETRLSGKQGVSEVREPTGGPADAGMAARRYLSWSRLGVSLVNYASCILTGVLAMLLADFDVRMFYAGLLGHALLSSEPHYGGGFECAEVFEIPFQLLGTIAFLIGITTESPLLVALAALTFGFEACFVKLSALVTWAVFFGMGVILAPWTALPAGAGGVVVAVMFAGWLVYLGRRPAQWLAPLRGHEASFSKQGAAARPWLRLREKGGCLVRAASRQPIIPVLALAGPFLGVGLHSVLVMYFVAAAAAYVAQSTDCRYYLLPLLPPIAIGAAGSAVALLDAGTVGAGVVVVAVGLWLFMTPLRAAGMTATRRNRWVWRGSRSPSQADENAEIAAFTDSIRPLVAGHTLLVYGPHNQAGVLTGASWSTPLVAPEHYLDDVCPGWQAGISEHLCHDPPEYVLDTGRCFDVDTARDGLGLVYRAVAQHGPFRLYRLESRTESGGTPAHVRTWRPLSASEWGRWGHGLEAAPAATHAGVVVPDEAGALRRRLCALAAEGHHGIAIYGAGRFTTRLADVLRASPVPVRVVLDDGPRPDAQGRFLDWPVVEPARVRAYDVDAIVILTDRYERLMRRRLRELGLSDIPVSTIGDAPPGHAARGAVTASSAR